jgi:hypothetical protein
MIKRMKKARVHHNHNRHFPLQRDILKLLCNGVDQKRLSINYAPQFISKGYQIGQTPQLSYNLSLPCREADSNDLQIASSAKKKGGKHTHTTHN